MFKNPGPETSPAGRRVGIDLVIAMLSPLLRVRDRPWLSWILLLACGEAADLATTKVDIARGALEGNGTVVNLMQAGGFGLVFGVKLLMVLAMVGIVLLVLRYTSSQGGQGHVVRRVVWHGLQLCVVVLMVTDMHNAVVLAQIQGWPAPGLLTVL